MSDKPSDPREFGEIIEYILENLDEFPTFKKMVDEIQDELVNGYLTFNKVTGVIDAPTVHIVSPRVGPRTTLGDLAYVSLERRHRPLDLDSFERDDNQRVRFTRNMDGAFSVGNLITE